ncbi:hypothetical protein NIES2135_68100 (plasmid) [Leptolyngbya boryana NIES-2135]|jgi:hypothetical protein|uniref:Uncharacterized protein n=1 Tax=Leptolyngbya boryana NIES-2135 TaxID=1973484 RepID=A0A1Z4JTG6_LEPBY|nr:hypothetical protein NIES2135_68100 [Leptolyngbya boryana NIES-2135]
MIPVPLPISIIGAVAPRFGAPPLTMVSGPNPVSISVDLVRLAIFLQTGVWL